MQVSFSFRTEIQKADHICKDQVRRGTDTEHIVQKERGRDNSAECCKDHVHMLVRIPPKYSVSEIMGYLKGKSSLMIFERHANLKYKYGNRHFWCRGVLRGYGGKEHQADSGVHCKLAEKGPRSGSDDTERVYRPVHG